jgi:hypothetical protein
MVAFSPPIVGCAGTLALEAPPTAGATGAPERLGSASFSLAPSTSENVITTLTSAGRAALAAGAPVAVHVSADLALTPSPASPRPRPLKLNFGWQQQPLGV